MADFVHLVGAEEVRAAGHAMRQAAEEMRHTVGALESSLAQQRQFMDDWLLRFTEVLEQHREASHG